MGINRTRVNGRWLTLSSTQRMYVDRAHGQHCARALTLNDEAHTYYTVCNAAHWGLKVLVDHWKAEEWKERNLSTR